MRSLDYGDTPHLLHQMHRTELRGPTNRARLNGLRAGHTEMHDFFLRSKEHYYFTLKNLEKYTIAYNNNIIFIYITVIISFYKYFLSSFFALNFVLDFSSTLAEYFSSTNISIFLISPYSIVASQDKAISQNVINTAANHKDIILISDLLQPQELLCRFLDKIRDLCRLQLKDTITMLLS
ncbi:hypothetical protein ALC53_10031 [Atta colombica]|uniref:Uncharacterized protein n=1 Tax=Atta colombica TaxID=520822 RepID=A0A195B5Q5_9HYME|nr:hypothetical protein ALC53_10031 [Atta colombica]